MADKELPNSRTAGRVPYRPGVFTRFNVLLGILAYSLLPIAAYWPAIHAHRVTMSDWDIIIAEVVFLQTALWFAALRCGSEELPFWQGVALVAGYMRTGWIYTDMLAAGLGVFLFLLMADFMALSSKPRTLYYRMLHLFYRIRLVQ